MLRRQLPSEWFSACEKFVSSSDATVIVTLTWNHHLSECFLLLLLLSCRFIVKIKTCEKPPNYAIEL